MPHFGTTRGKPLHARSPREIFWMLGVFPVIFGGGLLAFVTVNAIRHHDRFTGWDWFGVVWAIVVSTVLMIGLPATGRQELQRRRQFRDSANEPPQTPPSAKST